MLLFTCFAGGCPTIGINSFVPIQSPVSNLIFFILYIGEYDPHINMYFICTLYLSIWISNPKQVDCYYRFAFYGLIWMWSERPSTPSTPSTVRPDDKQVVGQGRGVHRPRTAQGVAQKNGHGDSPRKWWQKIGWNQGEIIQCFFSKFVPFNL